jgi:hypothetical protein
MAIRNPEKFLAGFWDWDDVSALLPGKMKVSDIDGFVEVNGSFLILETKTPGVPIPLGQKIAYERLQKTKLFTVLYLWGEKGAVEEMQVLYADGSTSPKRSATNEDFNKVVQWWVKRCS